MAINVLEPKVYNLIAAGEVVERPSSIVKELVENSIDAKSSAITVEIVGGGIKCIRVTDNGCGIAMEDLPKAFMPHATSKIKTADDLVAIHTLGFRGEALASIGAVAEVTITSKPTDAETAGTISAVGGVVSAPEVASASNGTTICSENLFFNLPARAKFLKKERTEEAEITNLMERFILCNPCLAFKYVADGKVVYQSTGKGIQDAMYCVYGKGAVEGTMYVEKDFDDMKIYGYIGKPTFTKPNRSYQTIALNHRYVINSTIASAIHNAYGEYLMKRQFPFYVLYIDMDFSKVDVNVHPNKLDVRFEESGKIYYKIFETINRALNGATYFASATDNLIKPQIKKTEILPEDEGGDKVIELASDAQPSEAKPTILSENNSFDVQAVPINPTITNLYTAADNSASAEQSEELSPEVNAVKPEELEQKRRQLFDSLKYLHQESDAFRSNINVGSTLLKNLETVAGKPVTEDDLTQGSFTATEVPRIVGTIFNTYIILEHQNKMFMLDQHAGHERLLFDKFSKEFNEGKIATQQLLVPYLLNTNTLEAEFLRENLQNLQALGFMVEEFGKESFRVTEVPFALAELNLKDFFDQILGDIKVLRQQKTLDFIRHRIATHACKSAVKGGDELSTDEIHALLAEFDKHKTVLLCPHGRPIITIIERSEIEKWFRRIV